MLKRYLPAILKRLDKAGILRHFNFTLTCRIKKKKLIIPVINGIGYQLLIGSEMWAITLYEKLLSIQPGTFIDAGANNGQTLLKIASIQKEFSYIGFEPNPGCFYYLKRLIAKNKFSGCHIYPVGLHYENKIVTLLSDNDFASGGSILEELRENKKRYKIRQHVPVMNGDGIFEQTDTKNISIIKADVEGAELEAIQGLQQTIKKYQPFIILEILPVYSLEKETGRFRKQRQDALLALMRSLGYHMFRINEQTNELLLLRDIEIHGEMHRTNYLFVHEEKVDLIRNNFSVTV